MIIRTVGVAATAAAAALFALVRGAAPPEDPDDAYAAPAAASHALPTSPSTRPGDAEAAPRQTASVPYDGTFTFTRIRYGSNRSRGGWGWRRGSAWAHDWPNADRNMQTMLNEFTAMRATTSGSNVFDLEDRSIFSHPIIYISEPGTWGITTEGAANLREYLLKGGFLIFDDFEHNDWYNMVEQVAEALPEGVWFELDPTHPIFGTFFYIEDIYVPHPYVSVMPNYQAIFEDNDPSKRVMVLANHNSDLAEYWEYAAQGYFPVDPTNDAFRLGINYLMYGVTH